MKVFISHAMPRATHLAEAFAPFLRRVVQGAEPWVSSTGIDKGRLFRAEIQASLDGAFAGVVCLTPENRSERWLLYEAGALSVKNQNQVWTLLLELEYTDVEAPLGDFQHTKAEKADIWRLVQAVRRVVHAAEGSNQTDDDVKVVFEALWPALEAQIAAIKAEGPPTPQKERSEKELMKEAVERLRGLDGISWRSIKTLGLLKHIYEVTTNEPVPSLKQLQDMPSKLTTRKAITGAGAMALADLLVHGRGTVLAKDDPHVESDDSAE